MLGSLLVDFTHYVEYCQILPLGTRIPAPDDTLTIIKVLGFLGGISTRTEPPVHNSFALSRLLSDQH